MKVIISFLFFTVSCGYAASAQTVSSQKRTQVTQPAEPVNIQIPASTTATLVSGARNAVMTEVPLENKKEVTEQKTEIISTEKKPK